MKTLTAFYDLAVGPPSYDFVVFGVQAAMERQKIGADRLHFVIVPDERDYIRPKPAIYSADEARWRLWNIVIPAAQLFGASVTLATDWNQAERVAGQMEKADGSVWPLDWSGQTLKYRHHLIGGVIERAYANESVPMLSASRHARETVRRRYAGKPVVTMTLRTTYLPDRNSDGAAWHKASEHIRRAGFGVQMIVDTATALMIGAGFGELNLDLRMASYQEAALNLHANSGASSLSWFSDKAYRMFGCGDQHWDGLFVKQGLPLGASWLWANPQQKLCYGQESSDIIISEFEAWRASGLGG